VSIEVTVAPDLQITIKDTGIGISQEHLSSLFDKFTKVKSSNKNGDIFEGAGLGLYIAQQYARELGGNISVISELNKGSCFILTIPHVNIVSPRD
jgi:signal transduction histidine kinase